MRRINSGGRGRRGPARVDRYGPGDLQRRRGFTPESHLRPAGVGVGTLPCVTLRRALALLLLTALIGAAVAEAATIRGNNRDNKLTGTPRNDRIDGRGGDDQLFGLRGNDRLLGAAGRTRTSSWAASTRTSWTATRRATR